MLRRTLRAILASTSVVAASSACFVAAHPDGKIFCDGGGDGSDCPAPLSCSPANVCVAAGSDVTPPKLDDVHFEPAAVNSGEVTLVITADEALDTARAPVLTFTSARDPGFALVPAAGDDAGSATQRMVALIDDADVEGTYVLTQVDVVDASGNPGSLLPNVSLVVDRTAPHVVSAAVVSAPPDGVFADIAGRDALTVVVQADEPIGVDDEGNATASLALQGAAATCALDEDDDTVATCTATITATVATGSQIPVVQLRDRAGNEAAPADVAPVAIDTASPQIVDGSGEVEIREGPLRVDAVGADSDVTLTFIASEDLDPAVAPEAFFVDSAGNRHDFVFDAVATGTGRRLVFALGPQAVPAGTYAVHARLADRVGHVAVIDDVPLFGHDGGLQFVGSNVCAVPPGAPSCMDLDGDRHFGTLNCPDGNDPDDLDATVFPGAPEIPGDGKDNSGFLGAGGVPMTEEHGKFVDSEAGDDVTGDGSRAAPFASMNPLNDPNRNLEDFPAFIAFRDTPVDGRFTSRTVIGGLDPLTWTPIPGARTPLADDSTVNADGAHVIIGIAASFYSVNSGFGIVSDCDLGTLRLEDDSIVLGGSEGILEIANGAHATVADNDALQAQVKDDGHALFMRSVVREGLRLGFFGGERGGDLIGVSSAFIGVAFPAIALDPSTTPSRVALYHSTIIADTGFPAVDLLDAPVPLQMIGNLVIGAPDAPAVVIDDAATDPKRIIDNAFVAAMVAEQGGTTLDVDALATMPSTVASGNVALADAGFASLFHLASGSLAANADVDVFAFDDSALDPIPTTAILDVDLQCRYNDGTADYGADEF